MREEGREIHREVGREGEREGQQHYSINTSEACQGATTYGLKKNNNLIIPVEHSYLMLFSQMFIFMYSKYKVEGIKVCVQEFMKMLVIYGLNKHRVIINKCF